MSTQLRITTWIAAFLLGGLVASINAPFVFGQGDESSFRSNASVEGKGLGGVLQRFFGSRDKTPESASRQATPRPSDRGSKPGIFQGGIVKQLRATTDDSQESHVRVEESRTSNEEQLMAPVPTAPSQMGQRTAREPFASDSNNPSSTARSSATQRSTASRDIFAEDPPSIVGTGVDNRKLTTTTSESKKFTAYDSLPPITKAQPKSSSNLLPPTYNAYKNAAKPSIEVELPRVSRKTVPNSEPKRTSLSTGSGYAIPRNPYTAPSATSVDEPISTRNSNTTTIQPTTTTSPSNASSTGGSPSNDIAKSVGPAKSPEKSSASSSETRLEMGVPKVKLFVSGPSTLQVGKSIPYEVVVRNEGAEILSGVIASMTIPATVKSSLPTATAGEFESEKDAAGVESLLWHVADLEPSQSRIFRVSLEATKAEHFTMDVEWTVLPQTGHIKVDVQQPQLNLALEGPSEVLWGKPEVYRLRVRNPGNAEVKDVEVSLTAETYGSNQTKLGDIPAGSERIVEVELTFQQSGTINIAGEAQSVIDSLESKSSIDVAVTQVDLAAEWNSPVEQYQGSIAEYSMKLSNACSISAENAVCVATLPAGLKVVSMPNGASQTGNEIRWAVPKIEPNTAQTFDFTFQATEPGATKLQANIQSLGGGKASAEAIVRVESVSDLKLTVTDPVAPAPVGQDVVYDLTIVNRGFKTAQAVKVLAQFSHGIEPVRAEGGTSRVLPGQVVFDPIESIQPGQEITLRVVAQATEAGMHRFRAELECEDGETQLIEEETTRYLATSRTDSSKSTIRR